MRSFHGDIHFFYDAIPILLNFDAGPMAVRGHPETLTSIYTLNKRNPTPPLRNDDTVRNCTLSN
jgi:hypothetical protein